MKKKIDKNDVVKCLDSLKWHYKHSKNPVFLFDAYTMAHTFKIPVPAWVLEKINDAFNKYNLHEGELSLDKAFGCAGGQGKKNCFKTSKQYLDRLYIMECMFVLRNIFNYEDPNYKGFLGKIPLEKAAETANEYFIQSKEVDFVPSKESLIAEYVSGKWELFFEMHPQKTLNSYSTREDYLFKVLKHVPQNVKDYWESILQGNVTEREEGDIEEPLDNINVSETIKEFLNESRKHE